MNDVFNLHDRVYQEIKASYKNKNHLLLEQKTNEILQVIWRHYDFCPSDEQLEIEINRNI